MRIASHIDQKAEEDRAAVGLNVLSTSRAVVQSWKEIASELSRGVRTVQRWERTLQLPVRRLGTSSRSPVYAFRDELHLWLANAAEGAARQTVVNAFAVAAGAEASGVDQRRFRRNALGNPSRAKVAVQRKCDERIAQSIKELFEHRYSAQKQCRNCESPMQFLDGNFQFRGLGSKWRVTVPFCPACDMEVLRYLRSYQIIH